MRPFGTAQPSEDSNAVWGIVSSLIAGLVVWGGLGALADHLLHVRGAFLAVGVLVGTAASLYGIVVRYGRAPVPPTASTSATRRKGV